MLLIMIWTGMYDSIVWEKVVGMPNKNEMRFYKTDSKDNDEIEFNESHNNNNNNNNGIKTFDFYFGDRRNDKRRNDI